MIFSGLVPGWKLRRFALWLVRDWKAAGVKTEPEANPKQDRPGPEGCGNYVRLPGRHYKRDYWPEMYDGASGLTGAAAVGHVIKVLSAPNDPGLIPHESYADAAVERYGGKTAGWQVLPSEDYDRRHPDVRELLERYDWTPVREDADGTEHWRHPTADHPTSATVRHAVDDETGVRLVYPFSPNTPLTAEKSHAPAAVLCAYEFAGDWRKLHADLAARGYGVRDQPGYGRPTHLPPINGNGEPTTTPAAPDMPTVTAGDLTLSVADQSGRLSDVVARLAGVSIHRNRFDPAVARDRKKFAADVVTAGPLVVSPAAVEKLLLDLADAPAPAADPAPPPAAAAGPPTAADLSAAALAATPPDIIAEAEALLADPKLIARLTEDIAAVGVAGERELATTLYLVGTSRNLSKPLAAIVQGPSSSGKSYVATRVADMFPPEGVIRATAMTPQALFHMPPGALSHRWIVAGERSRIEEDERAEATRALREMISAGKLSKLMPVKVEGGRIESVMIEQDGPIAFVESTTLLNVFAEDANRALMVGTDERDEQTAAVVAAVARSYAGTASTADADRICLVHQTAQRMIPRADVVIPFAPRVAELFDKSCVEHRRSIGHLLALVSASALLHHRQRPRDAAGRIVATFDDYVVAAQLAAGPLARSAGALPDAVQNFYQRLRSRLAAKIKDRTDWSTTDARDGETTARTNINRWLAALADARLIEQTAPGRGKVSALWRFTNESADHPAGRTVAPTPAEVFKVPGGPRSADTTP